MVEDNTAPLGNEFHRAGRSSQLPDGHHGPGAGRHDPGDPRSGEQADRFRPAGPPLSADGQRGRRAAPGRAYRGRRRSGPPGRAAAGRRALRNSRRRRRPGHARRALRPGREARPGDHHHRGADPHRRRSEKLVYRLAEADLPTRYGPGRIIAYGVQLRRPAADRHRAGRSRQRVAGAAGAAAFVLLHRRPAGLACAAIAATSCSWPWR